MTEPHRQAVELVLLHLQRQKMELRDICTVVHFTVVAVVAALISLIKIHRDQYYQALAEVVVVEPVAVKQVMEPMRRAVPEVVEVVVLQLAHQYQDQM
jgi:hypothetical protein